MRIEIRGRNAAVTESLRKHVDERFRKVAKQVSELATLELELRVERNPAIADGKIVDATLHLKGATLRATERSTDLAHSVDLAADNLSRQVKRHRDKRRRRREQVAAKTARAS
jgi:putative sigma-54 modulation protein